MSETSSWTIAKGILLALVVIVVVLIVLFFVVGLIFLGEEPPGVPSLPTTTSGP